MRRTVRVRVFHDPPSAALAAAERIVRVSDAAVRQRGRFAIAVSGGRTPEPLFRALARVPDGPQRWPSWQLFCCDERCVPPDDDRSNLGLARRRWLEPADFPPGNVHPVDTSLPAEEAARRYDAQLRAFFRAMTEATFDVVVLGIGPDGHTASLFPGSSTLEVADRWAVAEPNPALPPRVARVTLTLEALGRARTAVFLVCGSDKRAVVATLLARTGPGSLPLPAARVRPSETTEWFLDREAAPEGLEPGTDRAFPGADG